MRHFFPLCFFVLQRAFFFFICTVSGCDGGNRTRNPMRQWDENVSTLFVGSQHFVWKRKKILNMHIILMLAYFHCLYTYIMH
jgi:hypothetical protein